MSGIEILLDEVRGVHIPRDFARECLKMPGWSGVRDVDRDILLAGHEHESYWEAWDDVLGSATFTDPKGFTYALHQDGALFAYCLERMTLEEKQGLGFDTSQDLRDILDAHPDYQIEVTGAERERHIWVGPSGRSDGEWLLWEDAALDCVTANGLELNPSF